jgi:hypothetical protein
MYHFDELQKLAIEKGFRLERAKDSKDCRLYKTGFILWFPNRGGVRYAALKQAAQMLNAQVKQEKNLDI